MRLPILFTRSYLAFDEGERGDWSKESERGRERSGKGEMKAERDEYNNRRSFH